MVSVIAVMSAKAIRPTLYLSATETVGKSNSENILSKCGWSPLEGNSFRWKVERTFANGHLIYSDGQVDDTYRGEELRFDYKDK